jgi:hypothetical protein
LNELAGLECVDDILTLAKRKVADTSDLVNTAQETVEGLEKSVGSFSWVEKAEDLYEKAKATQPKIDELTRKLEALKRTIDDYKAIKNYPEIPEWLENGDKSAVIKGLEKELEICNNYVGTCRVLARVTPALDKLGALVFPQSPKHTEKEPAGIISLPGSWSMPSGFLRPRLPLIQFAVNLTCRENLYKPDHTHQRRLLCHLLTRKFQGSMRIVRVYINDHYT